MNRLIAKKISLLNVQLLLVVSPAWLPHCQTTRIKCGGFASLLDSSEEGWWQNRSLKLRTFKNTTFFLYAASTNCCCFALLGINLVKVSYSKYFISQFFFSLVVITLILVHHFIFCALSLFEYCLEGDLALMVGFYNKCMKIKKKLGMYGRMSGTVVSYQNGHSERVCYVLHILFLSYKWQSHFRICHVK